MNFWDTPCADPGLTSYRYHGQFGWIMIGATDHIDALREALRSTNSPVSSEKLEVWDGTHYVKVRNHD